MTERSMTHSTINLERTFDASPDAVFAAWASPEALMQWAVPGEGMRTEYESYAFVQGGREVSTFTMADGSRLRNEGFFGEMVQGHRFTSLYTMSHEGTPVFSGVLSVELLGEDDGCRLRMTEQGVFYDGHDLPENHKLGYEAMLRALSAYLLKQAA